MFTILVTIYIYLGLGPCKIFLNDYMQMFIIHVSILHCTFTTESNSENSTSYSLEPFFFQNDAISVGTDTEYVIIYIEYHFRK